jgi:hypothetical protein
VALWKLEHQPCLRRPRCGCASTATSTSGGAAVAAAASSSSGCGCAVACAIAANASSVQTKSARANPHCAAVLLCQASDDFQQGRLALYRVTAARLGSTNPSVSTGGAQSQAWSMELICQSQPLTEPLLP